MSPTTIPGNLILQSPTANDPLLDLNTQPSLDLQFATSKTLDDRVSGQNLITFSRSTTGTYVDSNGIIQTAAIDAPRFDHDPATGESLGLLIEESRTNLLTYSEEFDDNAWAKNSSTVTPNATFAPNGQNTADSLIENTATSSHSATQFVSVSSGLAYTFTVYAKANGRNYFDLTVATVVSTNCIVRFTLSGTGSSSLRQGSPTPTRSITALSNGWYRCQITITTTSAGSGIFQVALAPDATSSPFYTGDGTSGIYLWGAQLEAGSFPTSYIPTSGSTVTRAADVAEITGTNFSRWYEQSEGTVFASFDSAGGSPSRAAYGLGSVVASQGTNTSSDPAKFSWYDGSSNIQTANEVDFTTAARKTAASFTDTEVSICLEGGAVVTGTQSSVTETKIHLGARQAGVSKFLNGHIKRLTYYPYRLPDATLQEITS